MISITSYLYQVNKTIYLFLLKSFLFRKQSLKRSFCFHYFLSVLYEYFQNKIIIKVGGKDETFFGESVPSMQILVICQRMFWMIEQKLDKKLLL